jgi:hypothetical protein
MLSKNWWIFGKYLCMSLASTIKNGKASSYVRTGNVCDCTYWGLVTLNDATFSKLMQEQKRVTALCGIASVRPWPSTIDRCVLTIFMKSGIGGLLNMFSTRRECSWRSSPWHPCSTGGLTWGSTPTFRISCPILVKFGVEGLTALSTIWVSFKSGVVKAIFT